MKKITVFLTHSFGELDILLPLFYELNSQKKFQITIIVTVREIFEKIESNTFYKDLIHLLNIKLDYSPLYNKFNYDQKNFINRNITQFEFLNPIKYFRFLFKHYLSLKLFIKNFSFIFSDIIMFETTNQLKTDLIYFIFNKIFKKKIIIYHHGHSFNFVPIKEPKNSNNENNKFSEKYIKELRELEIATIKRFVKANTENKNRSKNENSIFLLYHPQNKDWARYLGFNQLHVLGFPKYFKEWMKFIKNESKFTIKQKHIVIFSRKPDHNYYMNKKNYEYLFRSTIEVLKEKLPNYKIYIKTHPRENSDFLKSLLNKYNVSNYEITNINSQILSKNAFLAVAFWSSAIQDSLILGIPSIEFYIENENFKILEPSGSMYKQSGVESVETKESFAKFVDKCIYKKYQNPKFVNELSNIQNLNVFFE